MILNDIMGKIIAYNLLKSQVKYDLLGSYGNDTETDSKSSGGDSISVRFRAPAPNKNKGLAWIGFPFFCI